MITQTMMVAMITVAMTEETMGDAVEMMGDVEEEIAEETEMTFIAFNIIFKNLCLFWERKDNQNSRKRNILFHKINPDIVLNYQAFKIFTYN